MFEYPASLNLETDGTVTEKKLNLRFTLSDAEGYRKGDYNIFIYKKMPGLDIKAKVQDQINFYAQNRLIRGNLIERKNYDLADFLTFKSIEVYEMRIKGTGYAEDEAQPVTQELWLAVLADEDYYYLVSLVGTARDLDIINWSRNAKAFEIMLESLRKNKS